MKRTRVLGIIVILEIFFGLSLCGCRETAETWAVMNRNDAEKLAGVWEGRASVPISFPEINFTSSLDVIMALSNKKGSSEVSLAFLLDFNNFLKALAVNDAFVSDSESVDAFWADISTYLELTDFLINGKIASALFNGDIYHIISADRPMINKTATKVRFTFPASFFYPGPANNEPVNIVLDTVPNSSFIMF